MLFKEWSSEKIFLLLATIVGGILIFLTPPMCTPDENTHFLNAYSISQGDVFPEVVDGQIGRYIKKSVVDFVNANNAKYVGNLSEKYNFSDFYYNSWLQDNSNEIVFYSNGATMGINPIGYLCSALGMLIGRGLTNILGSGYDTPYNLLIFGRISNLIFYLCVGFLAIKLAPCLKRTMMLLLLLPMSLALGSSLSYDAILISICALFVSNTMKILLSSDEYRINKTDILITGLCTFFMFGVKLVYAPLVLLLFCIPRKKFDTNKKYVQSITLIAIIIVIAYIIPNIMLNLSRDGIQLITDERILMQKEYLWSNTGDIPRIIIDTLKNNIGFYTIGFFGILGQLDTNFPIPLLLLIMLLFILVVLSELFTIKGVKKSQRIVSLLITIVIIVGMHYQIYITWTPLVSDVGTTIISGVQGRYFLPMFCFAIIPFMNNLGNRKSKWSGYIEKNKFILSNLLSVITSISTVLLVLLRFWI